MRGNQIIVFRLGEEEYAIESLDVMEIDRMKEIRISIVPKVPAYIEGIINLRGDIIPVIDLKKKFGINGPDPGRKQRLIIVRASGSMVGLLVDSVSGVENTSNLELLPPTDEMLLDVSYISAIAREDDRMIFILDVTAVAG